MEDLLPGDDDPRRIAVREWLRANPAPSPRDLAHSGYVAPHWPEPWGLGADPVHQLVIDDEFARAGVKRPSNQIGIGWAAPTIIHAGSEEQKQRYVIPALAGEEIWCQLFSEPGAGSDLASLSTRAVRDGDEWVVNGQKIWTTGAHYSQFGILIARTDPAAPKHRGITYFICPMDLPGIEVRNIRNIAGADSFNEVFFTDVRIPHANIVGEPHDGWRLAKVTLGNERVSLSSSGVLWGAGPKATDIIDEARALGVTDPVMRQRLVALWIEHTVLEVVRMRTTSRTVCSIQSATSRWRITGSVTPRARASSMMSVAFGPAPHRTPDDERDTRSLPRVTFASRQPSCGSPTMFACGIRTSVKKTSLKLSAPAMLRMLRTSMPGRSIGQMK